jgi:MoxR-like ATPase
MVLATQNPIEHEGTYPLPEAQTDRFMFKVKVTYPEKDEELEILDRMARNNVELGVSPVITPADIRAARNQVDEVYVDPKIKAYIVDIVDASRKPAEYGLELGALVEYGASPRASIYLALAARAHALLSGRGYVTPLDVKAIAMDVLRHRIILSYEGEAEGVSPDEIVGELLNAVAVP